MEPSTTAAVIVIAETIRARQRITARDLFVPLCGLLTLGVFDSCIRSLVSAKLVRTDGQTLTWIGPVSASDPAGDLLLGQGRH